MPTDNIFSNAAGDSLAARTASIIADVGVGNWKALPLERAVEGALAHPDEIADFVQAVVSDLPQSYTLLHFVLPLLPESDFPRVVVDTVKALTRNPSNASACAVIELVALQCPATLHPYLPTVFDLRSDQRGQRWHDRYDWRALWHEATLADVLPFLRSVIESDRSEQDCFDAWYALLETHDPDAIRYALQIADRVPMVYSHLSAKDHVRYVGYEVVDDGDGNRDSPVLRRLYSEPDAVFHLVFADGYVSPQCSPSMRPWAYAHPTWHLDTLPDAAPLPFGGLLRNVVGEGGKDDKDECVGEEYTASTCAACGGPLHHLLTLTPIPDGLGVTGLTRLVLTTCLSCSPQIMSALFFAHDADGVPAPTDYDGPALDPQKPIEMLVPTEVRLAQTPPRWRWQDGGASNGNENFSRVGGTFSWVQDIYYTPCPRCRQSMIALLQLELELPVETVEADIYEDPRNWGSDGLAYVLWCDACKISATFCQWT